MIMVIHTFFWAAVTTYCYLIYIYSHNNPARWYYSPIEEEIEARPHTHEVAGPNLCLPNTKIDAVSTAPLPWWEMVSKKNRIWKNHPQLCCWLLLSHVSFTLHGYCTVIEWFQPLKTFRNQTNCVFWHLCFACPFIAAALNYSLPELALKEFFSNPSSIKWQPMQNPHARQLQLWKASIETLIPTSPLKITVPRACCYLEGYD